VLLKTPNIRTLFIEKDRSEQMKQGKIHVHTKAEAEQIKNELWNGKNITEISYHEFVQKQKQLPSKLPIIEIINGYGIYAYEPIEGTTLFGSIDMKTGIPTIYGRRSLNEIRSDIKKDFIKKIEEEYPGIYSVKTYYDTFLQQHLQEQRYGGRANRFPLCGERFVLDVGAGDHPDLRATHAIDRVMPSKHFTGLEYQTGHDLQSSTVALPYQDNFFDRVVSYGGLGINFESLALYREIHRILKPGGSLEFNHASQKTKKWLEKVGFKDIRSDTFWDEIINKKIAVVITTKLTQETNK
jgi:SAM-dependent methyltransferase